MLIKTRRCGAHEGSIMVITHNKPVDSPTSSEFPLSPSAQRTYVKELRHRLLLHYRPLLSQGAGPIRVMARVVTELQQQCREFAITDEIMQAEVVNRTIGDVNLRLVTECEGEPGGPGDYRMLADELGVALPNESLHGYVANGETYLWLRNEMTACERMLLDHNIDLSNYDIFATGNSILRGWLAEEMRQWGLFVTAEQVYLGLGGMDSLNKVFCGLSQLFCEQGESDYAVLFPEPGFGTPEWQARSYNYRLQRFQTRPEDDFKLTAAQLDLLLNDDPHIRVIYLTITNNPTTFAYTPDELRALHAVVRAHRAAGHNVLVLADLAYIGTGRPEEDKARMAAFAEEDVLQHCIFVSSLSKTYTLTGQRFGWVTVGDPALAPSIAPGWSNSMASLPSEWQLRFMAYVKLIRSRPWLAEKLRNFYRLRRQRFIHQLQRINAEQPLFANIFLDDDATVYNWSQLLPGEDAFTLFEKTGIAGVPGSGFGYSDDYVRFSIGVIPVPDLP
jgi:aspartate/methionine/tyrosine aminotransferase